MMSALAKRRRSDGRQTLADQVTGRLRVDILRGGLAPGTQLVERDLAASYGISRVPIREAIHRLVDEGLVKFQPHRGGIVYLPSPLEIEEIASLRIVLEHAVTERVIARWNDGHERELRAIVDDFRAAAAAQDHRRLVELDAQFHGATWRIADHAVLAETAASLRQRVNRLLFETILLMSDEQLHNVARSHEALVAVFRQGDVEVARAEMSRHITSSKDRILAVYQRLSEPWPAADAD